MAAVLLALMVWGLRARPTALASPPSTASPASFLILSAFSVVAATVLVALARHHPRRRCGADEREQVVALPSTRWDKLRALTAIVVLVLILVLVLWASAHPVGGGAGSERIAPSPTPSRVTTGTGTPGPSATAWLPDALVVLCLFAAACLILTSRLRRRTHSGVSPWPATVRARATFPGSWKQSDHGDARGQVVAAFRAFEEDAARLGVPVDPPETAVDIAQHPVTVKAADPNTIADLTALFHRARYSREMVTDADKDRAQDLLRRIRSQLGRAS